MGTVVQFPRLHSPSLTKRQLAQHLGYSTRWIEQRVAEGMPSGWKGNRRVFSLSEVEAWLAEN